MHGTLRQHDLWYSRCESWRGKRLLFERHDVDTRAGRGRSHPHEFRSCGIITGSVRAQIARVLFDGPTRSRSASRSLRKKKQRSLTKSRHGANSSPFPLTQARQPSSPPHYSNTALARDHSGRRMPGWTIFDFANLGAKSPRERNPDNSVSFMTISPVVLRIQFVVGHWRRSAL